MHDWFGEHRWREFPTEQCQEDAATTVQSTATGSEADPLSLQDTRIRDKTLATPIMLRIGTCFFVCLLSSFARLCIGDCAEPLSIQEQFEASPLVARLMFTSSDPATLPCGLEAYDEEEGTIILDTLPVYEVLEVFKGNVTAAEIPIVWGTDTGFRQQIPSSFNATEGFLAFLAALRYCNNGTNFFLYPDDFEPTPYEMNECVVVSQPWSTVSDEDRAFLKYQNQTASTQYTPSSATKSNSGAYMNRCLITDAIYLGTLVLAVISFL